MLDCGTNLINTCGLPDSLAQHLEIAHRWFGMHRKPHQDGGSGKHLDKAFTDLLQKVLSSVVDPTTAKFDAKTRACIPVDLDDVGGKSRSPARCLRGPTHH